MFRLPLARHASHAAGQRHPETVMSRYVAPLGFTLAAVWIAVLFVMASGTA
ncbi:hypothetical protein [Melissospora conviva]|uniref:hypothetical protein n=1 Tax=Melissospora conviva TaxID=3388432 RepID=UPI003B823F19